MTAPLPAVFVQGLAVVSSDNLNTFVQTVTNFAQLRTFTGLTSMLAIVQGGATVIMPTGAVSGAWLKLATVYSYQTPTTGFSIQVANGVTSLLLDPAGTLATGAVIFPVTPIDGQTLSISSSQTITALTLSAPTGQTILSAITTLAANDHTAWQYTASVSKWFRVS